jgi:hypothetical protein
MLAWTVSWHERFSTFNKDSTMNGFLAWTISYLEQKFNNERIVGMNCFYLEQKYNLWTDCLYERFRSLNIKIKSMNGFVAWTNSWHERILGMNCFLPKTKIQPWTDCLYEWFHSLNGFLAKHRCPSYMNEFFEWTDSRH